MVFELGRSVGMVLGAPVRYPLEGAIETFIGLELVNYFGTWELCLVSKLTQ